MTDRSRIQCKAIADKVMSAEEAAALISSGDRVGMSGFTGSGHPKAVPAALTRRAVEAAARGDHFTVSVWTASAAPQLGGALAAVDGIDLRMPYQSDPVTRAKINGGLLGYLDVHLSHVAQMVREGFFGHLDVAVVEAAGVTADSQSLRATCRLTVRAALTRKRRRWRPRNSAKGAGAGPSTWMSSERGAARASRRVNSSS